MKYYFAISSILLLSVNTAFGGGLIINLPGYQKTNQPEVKEFYGEDAEFIFNALSDKKMYSSGAMAQLDGSIKYRYEKKSKSANCLLTVHKYGKKRNWRIRRLYFCRLYK